MEVLRSVQGVLGVLGMLQEVGYVQRLPLAGRLLLFVSEAKGRARRSG
jgi:hypothetical protein